MVTAEELQDAAEAWTDGIRHARPYVDADRAEFGIDATDVRQAVAVSAPTHVPVGATPVVKVGASVQLKRGEGWSELPPGRAELNGGTLKIAGDLTGWTFLGPGRIEIGGYVLVEPNFEDVTVIVESTSHIDLGSGTIRLTFTGAHAAFVSGRADEPLRVLTLRLDGAGPELLNVDIFGLDYSSLPHLLQASRLQPWWPQRRGRWRKGTVDRAEAKRRAMSIVTRVNDPSAQRDRLATFWTEIDRKIRGNADGVTQALVREIAIEGRRHAAGPWSPERILLSVLSFLGYGTRLGRPLVIWAGVTVFAATFIGLRSDALTDWGFLFGEILMSPLTLLRALPESSPLFEALEDQPWNQVMLQVARVLGSVCAVLFALAIRAHTRLTRDSS